MAIRRVIVFLFPLVVSCYLLIAILRLAYTEIPTGDGGMMTSLNMAAFMSAAIGSLLFVCSCWTYNPMAAYGGLHLYLWILPLSLSYVLSGNIGTVFYTFYLPIPELWPVIIIIGIISSSLLFIFRKEMLAVLAWFMVDGKQKTSIQLDEKGSIPYELGYGGVVAKVKEEEWQTESHIAADEMPHGSYPEMMQGRD